MEPPRTPLVDVRTHVLTTPVRRWRRGVVGDFLRSVTLSDADRALVSHADAERLFRDRRGRRVIPPEPADPTARPQEDS